MTEPLKQLYDPESVKKQAEPLIKIIDPLLEEEINRATQLLQQCLEAIAETGTKERDKTIPAISLFLHIIEISDGIHELLRQVCTDAAAPLLRALFESMLSLRFIVDKIDNPDVAMAWYVNSLKQRRTALEKADPVTKSRKKKARKGVAPTPTLDEKKRSKAFNAELKRLNRRIDVDYKALAQKIKNKKWYAPFGGGASLEQLAANLQFRKGYTLYRMWSTRIHSTDTDFLLGSSEKGHPIFRGIRDPSKLKDYGSLTSTMLLNSIRTMAEGYCPKVDIGSWYVNRVRSLQIGLLQIEIVVSTDAPLKKE